MKQTLEPEQKFATIENSLETCTAIGETVARAALDRCMQYDIPYQVIDEYAVHSALNADIKSITGFVGTVSPEGVMQLRQNIQKNAIDLAAHILPADIREAYELKSVIPDNEGYLHPPSTDEVYLLGQSWDITKDDTIKASLEAAIEELVDIADVKMMRHILRMATHNQESFTTTYVKLHAEMDEVDIDAPIGAKAYMAHGVTTPEDTAHLAHTRYITDSYQELSEVNEMYVGHKVTTVPTAFVPQEIFDEATGSYVHDSIPRLFMPPVSKETRI